MGDEEIGSGQCGSSDTGLGASVPVIPRMRVFSFRLRLECTGRGSQRAHSSRGGSVLGPKLYMWEIRRRGGAKAAERRDAGDLMDVAGHGPGVWSKDAAGKQEK